MFFQKAVRSNLLTIKQRTMQPAAPGKSAYQSCKLWNFGPSINKMGKLAAARIHKWEMKERTKQEFSREEMKYRQLGQQNHTFLSWEFYLVDVRHPWWSWMLCWLKELRLLLTSQAQTTRGLIRQKPHNQSGQRTYYISASCYHPC